MRTSPPIRFPKDSPPEFYATVRARVHASLETRGLDRFGGQALRHKALFLLGSWLGIYAVVLFSGAERWVLWLLCIGLGLGKALVGASVMHDACHGTLSRHRWLNSLAANTMLLLGGDKLVWQTSHNLLHHSFTNIHGHDIDLDAGRGMLRFSPQAEWKPHHRYQAWYAYFLYSLLTLMWVLFTDFAKMRRFVKAGLTYGRATNVRRNWAILVLGKLGYYAFWMGLPLALMDISFGQWLVGFLTMHLVAGLSLTLVFQLAHLTPEADMPTPDLKGNMKEAWAIHQLETTADWATRYPLANWLTGGLNHQVEHHLFPRISHVHYPVIAPIVRETAAEFAVPYKEFGTFGEGLKAHLAFMRQLSLPPEESRLHAEPKTP